jgi:hypothetical protein
VDLVHDPPGVDDDPDDSVSPRKGRRLDRLGQLPDPVDVDHRGHRVPPPVPRPSRRVDVRPVRNRQDITPAVVERRERTVRSGRYMQEVPRRALDELPV